MKVKSNVNTQAMMASQSKTGQPKAELRKAKSTGDIKTGSGFEFDQSSKSEPTPKRTASESNLLSKKKISTEVAVGSIAAGVVAISAMPTAAPLVLAVLGAAYLLAPKAEEEPQRKPESQPRGEVKLAPAPQQKTGDGNSAKSLDTTASPAPTNSKATLAPKKKSRGRSGLKKSGSNSKSSSLGKVSKSASRSATSSRGRGGNPALAPAPSGAKPEGRLKAGLRKTSDTIKSTASKTEQAMDTVLNTKVGKVSSTVSGHVENSAEDNAYSTTSKLVGTVTTTNEGNHGLADGVVGALGAAGTCVNAAKDILSDASNGKVSVSTMKNTGKAVMDSGSAAANFGASGTVATAASSIAAPVYAVSAAIDGAGAATKATKARLVATHQDTPDDLKTIANYTAKKSAKKVGRRATTGTVAGLATAGVAAPAATALGVANGAHQVASKMIRTARAGGTFKETVLMQKDKAGDRRDAKIRAQLSENGQLEKLNPQQVQAKAEELEKKGKHKEAQALLQSTKLTGDGSSTPLTNKQIQIKLAQGNRANERMHMAEALVAGMEEDRAKVSETEGKKLPSNHPGAKLDTVADTKVPGQKEEAGHYEHFASSVLRIDKEKLNPKTSEERTELIGLIADAMKSN